MVFLSMLETPKRQGICGQFDPSGIVGVAAGLVGVCLRAFGGGWSGGFSGGSTV